MIGSNCPSQETCLLLCARKKKLNRIEEGKKHIDQARTAVITKNTSRWYPCSNAKTRSAGWNGNLKMSSIKPTFLLQWQCNEKTWEVSEIHKHRPTWLEQSLGCLSKIIKDRSLGNHLHLLKFDIFYLKSKWK